MDGMKTLPWLNMCLLTKALSSPLYIFPSVSVDVDFPWHKRGQEAQQRKQLYSF